MADKARVSQAYSVTSAGISAAEDRAHRMRMYYISMSLRVVCVASLFWARGWWVLVAAVGAIVLPWFAVMVGNAVSHVGGASPEQPDPLQIESAEETQYSAAQPEGDAADTLIVVDVEPERRGGTVPGADPGLDPEKASSPEEGTA